MTDIFRDRKLVHVKLDKETHASLRSALFKAGLTMQEVLSEFCRQYVDQSAPALRIVENYVNKKNLYRLKIAKEGKKFVKRPQYELSEADKAAIYDMLNESSSHLRKEET